MKVIFKTLICMSLILSPQNSHSSALNLKNIRTKALLLTKSIFRSKLSKICFSIAGIAAIALLIKKFKPEAPVYEPEDLSEAIEKGNITLTKKIIKTNPNLVNTKPISHGMKEYDIPLNSAIKCNNVEIVKFLLNHKDIDVNSKNEPPLELAMENKNIEIVKILLNHKNIDLNLVNSKEIQALLYWAIENKNIEIVKNLLKHDNVDLNQAIDRNAPTPLELAIEKKNLEIIKLLLNHNNIDLNLINWNDQQYPINKVIEQNDANMFEFFLEKGANINIIINNNTKIKNKKIDDLFENAKNKQNKLGNLLDSITKNPNIININKTMSDITTCIEQEDTPMHTKINAVSELTKLALNNREGNIKFEMVKPLYNKIIFNNQFFIKNYESALNLIKSNPDLKDKNNKTLKDAQPYRFKHLYNKN